MDFTRIFRIKLVFTLVRIVLGGIFITAAVPKILQPADFAKAVFNYQILPLMLINPFALILPWIELAVGVLLISGLWLESAVILVDILLAVFLAVAGFNLSRGLDIACGCFGSGSSSQPAGLFTFLRDLLLLLFGLYLLVSLMYRRSADR